jgi:hypothetical protein
MHAVGFPAGTGEQYIRPATIADLLSQHMQGKRSAESAPASRTPSVVRPLEPELALEGMQTNASRPKRVQMAEALFNFLPKNYFFIRLSNLSTYI